MNFEPYSLNDWFAREWRDIDFSPKIKLYGYQKLIEGESTMDTKLERKLLNLSEDEKLAYDKGYIDEDGELTGEGRNLLVELLFENDDELADLFFAEIRAMDGKEE